MVNIRCHDPGSARVLGDAWLGAHRRKRANLVCTFTRSQLSGRARLELLVQGGDFSRKPSTSTFAISISPWAPCASPIEDWILRSRFLSGCRTNCGRLLRAWSRSLGFDLHRGVVSTSATEDHVDSDRSSPAGWAFLDRHRRRSRYESPGSDQALWPEAVVLTKLISGRVEGSKGRRVEGSKGRRVEGSKGRRDFARVRFACLRAGRPRTG